MYSWMESMSALKTRAPSFASKAARGRPTTSELRRRTQREDDQAGSYDVGEYRITISPVDDEDRASIGTVAVREQGVINATMLECLHDRQGRARQD